MNDLLLIKILSWIVVAIAAFTDLRERRIPNRLLLFGLVTAIVVMLIANRLSLTEVSWRVAVGLAAWLIFMIFAVMRWMGHGDAKLLALLCLMLGPIATLETLLASCCIALPFALVIKHRDRRPQDTSGDSPPTTGRTLLPFAPFLSVALTLHLALDALTRPTAL